MGAGGSERDAIRKQLFRGNVAKIKAQMGRERGGNAAVMWPEAVFYQSLFKIFQLFNCDATLTWGGSAAVLMPRFHGRKGTNGLKSDSSGHTLVSAMTSRSAHEPF